MQYFSKKRIKIASIAILLALAVFFVFFSRMIPYLGIKIIVNNNEINYLKISNEIYYRQTINNCAPYAVMGVINVLTGEKKDPELLVKQTRWRIMRNLTFPQGVIDLLHKHNIKTKEYSLKLYSNADKITWLKNQIDHGNPAILLVKVKNIQHYFTVIGYDKNGFMLYDSLQEKQNETTMKTKIDREEYTGNRYYTNDELTGLWNNGGYKIFFRNWAVVCYNKENPP
jgi:predicted double-glycine peptidase